MKKNYLNLLLALTCFAGLAACNQPGEEPSQEPSDEPQVEATLADTEFGWYVAGNNEVKVDGEEYTIVIDKMYGLSKADAPLHITGTWKCKFIR